MQPAERISKVPTQKVQTRGHTTKPPAANQSAHSVGHSSSSVPIGLCRRISFSYSVMRSMRVARCMEID